MQKLKKKSKEEMGKSVIAELYFTKPLSVIERTSRNKSIEDLNNLINNLDLTS